MWRRIGAGDKNNSTIARHCYFSGKRLLLPNFFFRLFVIRCGREPADNSFFFAFAPFVAVDLLAVFVVNFFFRFSSWFWRGNSLRADAGIDKEFERIVTLEFNG